MAKRAIILSSLLALMLMTGTGYLLIPEALAQAMVSIKTSADSHDNAFFGESVLQIVVTDPHSNDDDGTVEDIIVDIDARSSSGSGDSISITVPETSESSGRFEFFLAHRNAVATGPSELSPLNNAGVEGDGACAADCAPFVTFGPAGDLDIDSSLFEEASFEIAAGDADAEINYEETAGTLELDRTSYGTTSFVYITIKDQDANLNPFERDELAFDPDSAPNDDLLSLGGGTFEAAATFRETGDNTGVFEGRYQIGSSIELGSESLVLTLFEKANYNASHSAPENDSSGVDEVSFTVGNSDGTITIGGGQTAALAWDARLATDKDSYSLGESMRISVEDRDANLNSGTVDSIHLRLSSGNGHADVLALETGKDTGVFEASLTLGLNGTVAGTPVATDGAVTILYTDNRPANYSEMMSAGKNPEKDFSIEFRVVVDKPAVEATAVADPVVKGVVMGNSVPFVPGAHLALSTTIVNNNNNNSEEQPFVAIIEVRDSSDITVFLAWQTGTLTPEDGSFDLEVAWQPEKSGDYYIRTFAITSIVAGGEVLSPAAVSEITIG